MTGKYYSGYVMFVFGHSNKQKKKFGCIFVLQVDVVDGTWYLASNRISLHINGQILRSLDSTGFSPYCIHHYCGLQPNLFRIFINSSRYVGVKKYEFKLNDCRNRSGLWKKKEYRTTKQPENREFSANHSICSKTKFSPRRPILYAVNFKSVHFWFIWWLAVI